MSESADFLYKCSDFYDPSSERGIAWNDPDLAIDWRIDQPFLSQKDSNYPTLRSLPPELLPTYCV
jgi:dTDP-4-dehydrorhamnose 3,5-epimerase